MNGEYLLDRLHLRRSDEIFILGPAEQQRISPNAQLNYASLSIHLLWQLAVCFAEGKKLSFAVMNDRFSSSRNAKRALCGSARDVNAKIDLSTESLCILVVSLATTKCKDDPMRMVTN